MYLLLKKVAKAIFPPGMLIKYEELFRSLILPFYLGKKFKCNICGTSLRKFTTLKNGDKLCPKCGSLSRNRRLWELLKEDFKPEMKILHFSPSRSLYRKLKSWKGLNYVTTDFEGEFLADHKFDITTIDSLPDSFERIICYHVLEHIPDDEKAIKELYRILKPGGKANIQTPFKQGEIFEDPTISEPLERKKHFGQVDHVRVYSVEGLKSRLNDAGFDVELLEFKELPSNYHAFSPEETILVASKKS